MPIAKEGLFKVLRLLEAFFSENEEKTVRTLSFSLLTDMGIVSLESIEDSSIWLKSQKAKKDPIGTKLINKKKIVICLLKWFKFFLCARGFIIIPV